ncbi:MAG: UDP-N-acetylmuramoyl-tripeptide--D-alanyl-D-alanine ligase, partial [Bacteroidota bacterium]
MIETLYAYFLQHRKICTDTRKIEPQAIFFALKGDNFNGNKFAAAALDGGCAYAVVDEPQDTEDPRFLMVDDVLATLQQLARHHREQLNIPVIGITGSNGKTTTKELMQAVLSKRFNTWATQGNLNNHIGVPLTLLSITPEHEVAIIEMGANHQGEIGTLCSFAQPDYGLITNIGKAHLEGFGGLEGVIKAKRQLYDHLRQHGGTVFVNMDNPLLADLSEGMNIISYGTAPERNFVGAVQPDGLTLALKWRTEDLSDQSVTTSLVGDYNFENALAAIAVGWQFGVGAEAIGEALAAYVPQNQRSQLLRQNNREIVLDAYNANP